MRIFPASFLSAILIPLSLLAVPVWALPGSQVLMSTEDWIEVEVIVETPSVEGVPGTPWVEVGLHGYGYLQESGAPKLPAGGILLAIPPGVQPRAMVLEVEDGTSFARRPIPVPYETIVEGTEDVAELPGFDLRLEPDSRIYDGAAPYPASVISIGEPAWMRHQRVVGIQVRPVQWDPRSASLVSARRIRFRVEFDRTQGLQGIEGGRTVPPVGSWERIYESQILNYEQGKMWRRAAAAPVPSFPMRGGGGAGPRLRIGVSATGIYKLTYESLEQAGVPGGLSWSQIALRETWHEEDDPVDPFKEREIHYLREETDVDGSFGPGESLVFFAQDRWDAYKLPRFPESEEERRFGRENVYWLQWDAGSPTPMEEKPSWQEWTGLPDPPLPVMTRIAEKDSIYGYATTLEDRSRDLPEGRGMLRSSHYTWTHEGIIEPSPPHWAFFRLPRDAQVAKLVTELQGVRKVPTGNSHQPSLFLARRAADPQQPWVQWAFPGNPYTSAFKQRVVVTLMEEDLTGVSWAYEPDSMAMVIDFPSGGHGTSIDRIILTYERPYLASVGSFAFNTSGMTGPQEFNIDGFETSDILAFEITDSALVASLPLSPEQVESTSEGFEASIQIDAGDGSSPRTFLLVERSRIPELPASSLRVRETVDLTGPGSEDYVAIYYGAFGDTLQPLLQHRESQGHSVLAADVEDVYDNFNGGRKSPVAIRNFLRYLFRTRAENAPVYVLLVGDASDDHANRDALADFNFMPTMTLPSWAFSAQGPELVSNDVWFVDNLNFMPGQGEDPERMDFFLDMHIGRLPAGNNDELSTMVRKIIRYENFDPGDHWRNRGVFLADDMYSSTISFDQDYCRRQSERVFQRGCEGALQHLFNAGFLDFEADSFFLSKHLDTLRIVSRCEKDTAGTGLDPCDPALADVSCNFDEEGNIRYCGCIAWEPNRDQGEVLGSAGPLAQKLIESLSRGGLFWNAQCHANKGLMTHEFVFRERPLSRTDVERLENLGKPFLFFGFGCHLAQFSEATELNPRSKDCIGEKLLFHGSTRNSLGAVGCVASTGYEWLSANDELNTAIFDAFFTNPPQPDGRARWIFGETLTAGKAILMGRSLNDNDSRGMVLTYSYLGDPGLRMDMAPPRLMVSVEEEEVEDGVLLRSEDTSDSVHVSVGVLDEVAVEVLSVQDYGGPLPGELIVVEPDPGRPDRAFTAAFDLGLRPDTYGVVMRTADASGRERNFTLQLELLTEFLLKVGDEETRLEDGAFVPNDAEIIIVLDSPVFLSPEDLEVLMDDGPWQMEAVALEDLVDGEAHTWRLMLGAVGGLSEGEHTVVLQIQHPDQQTVTQRSVGFNSADPLSSLRILELYNFPNPFEEATEFHYRLNNQADRAKLSVFTVGGKRILDMDVPARINENVVLWDGRDQDGDPVSNGLYFYKLRVWGLNGKASSRIERIVRAR